MSPIEVALTSTFALASSASMMDSCQGIARRSMCAALRLKCLTSDSPRCRWRLNTITRWKPSRIRPWTTARAPPPAPSTTAWRGIFWRPTSLSRASLKPGTSVLCPTSFLPSLVMVLSAPVAWASSVSLSTMGTTRSLWGIVTFAPRKSSPRSSAIASARVIGARSHSS